MLCTSYVFFYMCACVHPFTWFVPMTWTCVLAVMLVATLVATHSHSPWSSLVSDLNCKLPRGRTLCLLLLGFPTCSQPRSRDSQTERERCRMKDSQLTIKQHKTEQFTHHTEITLFSLKSTAVILLSIFNLSMQLYRMMSSGFRQ